MELLQTGPFRDKARGLAFQRFSQRVLVSNLVRGKDAHTGARPMPCLNEALTLQPLKRFSDR
jgi:hypothetical protein